MGPSFVCAMRNLTSGVFENLEILSHVSLDKRVKRMYHLLMGQELKKYKTFLEEFKDLDKGIAGYRWMLGVTKYITMQKFWTWSNLYGVNTSGYLYLGVYRCLNFNKYIWFEVGKSMRKKHQSVFQNRVKYIHNDIVKPFIVGIRQYAKRVREMQDLAK